MKEKLKNVLRDRIDYPNAEDIEEIADAILDAMMEPSEEMLSEGIRAHSNLKEIWQAMLKAAKEM